MTADILVLAQGAAGLAHQSTLEASHVARDIAARTGWRWAKLQAPAGCDMDAIAGAVAAASQDARMVLAGATATGKDVMARVAALLQVPLAQDCTAYGIEGDTVTFTRPLYGGKLFADVVIDARPVLATFRPRAQPSYAGTAAVLTGVAAAGHEGARVRMDVRTAAAGRALDVTEADIVISGGRGMQGPEHWHILEALAAAMGPRTALACSRPVSDDGWRPRAEHVGQTGRAIAPDVYIACGISGAIQHVAGIAASKCIIAINRDADAPIFKVADYGIVGDLFEVVPALTKAVRALRGG